MARGVNPQDGYLEALVKNMPSETVAGYLAILGFLSTAPNFPTWAHWVIWGLFLVATPLYLWLVKPKGESQRRPWWQVWIFSPIAFLAWSMTIGGPWNSIDSSAIIGGVLILLMSVLIFPLVSMGITRATA